MINNLTKNNNKLNIFPQLNIFKIIIYFILF